jgi:hypothetical protein
MEQTPMQKGIFNSVALFSVVASLGWVNAAAQQVQSRPQRPGGSAEGTLTVTATVVSSTGLVIGPDGQMRVIVANATEPGNSASPSPEVSAKLPERAREQKLGDKQQETPKPTTSHGPEH